MRSIRPDNGRRAAHGASRIAELCWLSGNREARTLQQTRPDGRHEILRRSDVDAVRGARVGARSTAPPRRRSVYRRPFPRHPPRRCDPAGAGNAGPDVRRPTLHRIRDGRAQRHAAPARGRCCDRYGPDRVRHATSSSHVLRRVRGRSCRGPRGGEESANGVARVRRSTGCRQGPRGDYHPTNGCGK